MNKLVKKKIESLIKKNSVILFMKGTPQEPRCGFSSTVVNIMKVLNVKFAGVNVLENEEIREGIKEYSDWPTLPQLYVKEEFVGGCDIVEAMYRSGELQLLLNKINSI